MSTTVGDSLVSRLAEWGVTRIYKEMAASIKEKKK